MTVKVTADEIRRVWRGLGYEALGEELALIFPGVVSVQLVHTDDFEILQSRPFSLLNIPFLETVAEKLCKILDFYLGHVRFPAFLLPKAMERVVDPCIRHQAGVLGLPTRVINEVDKMRKRAALSVSRGRIRATFLHLDERLGGGIRKATRVFGHSAGRAIMLHLFRQDP